ncbi:MAG: hypothetical protein ACSLFK_09680 [Gemmatimonadaceae bacterium]
MTAPFVTEIRAPHDVIALVGGEGPVVHLRVQVAELWDVIRIDAPASSPFTAVKKAALAAFYPAGAEALDFVGKVRGFEILHEGENLEKCGIRDGSTILLTSRRRRPVK